METESFIESLTFRTGLLISYLIIMSVWYGVFWLGIEKGIANKCLWWSWTLVCCFGPSIIFGYFTPISSYPEGMFILFGTPVGMLCVVILSRKLHNLYKNEDNGESK